MKKNVTHTNTIFGVAFWNVLYNLMNMFCLGLTQHLQSIKTFKKWKLLYIEDQPKVLNNIRRLNFYATCSNRLMWAICQQLMMTKMVTKSKLFEVGGFTCLPIIAYCLLCSGCLSQRKLSCSPEFPSFLSYWLTREANGSAADLKEH